MSLIPPADQQKLLEGKLPEKNRKFAQYKELLQGAGVTKIVSKPAAIGSDKIKIGSIKVPEQFGHHIVHKLKLQPDSLSMLKPLHGMWGEEDDPIIGEYIPLNEEAIPTPIIPKENKFAIQTGTVVPFTKEEQKLMR